MAETNSQDAIALLKRDHRAVEELFEKFEKASGDGRKQKLAEEICLELSVHAQIEEEIFYPACEGKVDEDLLKESYVEHDGAKVLIAEIMLHLSSPNGISFDAKLDGSDTPIKGDPAGTTASVKKLSDNSYQETDKRDGKVVWVGTYTVGPDGRLNVQTENKLDGSKFSYSADRQQ